MADENNTEIVQEVAQNSVDPGARNPFVSLMLILNAALLGAVGYFQFQSFEKEKNKADIRDVIKAEMASIKVEEDTQVEGALKVNKTEGQLLQLDPFTANLAQGDGPKRFVRMTTVLSFTNQTNQEEFKARKAQIRDSIISILNSKRPEDLLKVEGKQYLKSEIKSAINSYFVDGEIQDVFYTSFQIN